ncbi:MAG: chromate efflux transporter [Nevskiales bacterium]|nr:chromate efflux transporter [Nevskiales bacterium]
MAPVHIPFREALRYWLRLGFISFGGPAGQIALLHAELVEKRHWISERRFLHALNYCMVLPGPEAQQLATYIGWLLHGVKGGLAAGVLFVLPSLLILMGLSWAYLALGDTPVLAGVLYGVKPAVTVIVLHAAWRIGRRILKNAILAAMAAAAFVAAAVFTLPFPLIILAAAILGYAGGRWAPATFTVETHAGQQRKYGPALIDDDTPSPSHAVFSWKRLVRYAGIGLGLWGMAVGTLALAQGWHGTLVQMAGFFTKAALLTFGGAYAVLPYVFQAAVMDYQWLTTAQMMDGLALGETTPGPLIMVVAFVGFVGGWQQQVLGADALLWSGMVAATVATFFTFLPSFLFILLGGPLVESTHGDLKFTAPLTGITAAVVGVILNLAAFFAGHVLWPRGYGGGVEWPSLVLGLGAAVALFRYSAGILPTMAGCALLGLAYSLLF